MAVVLAVIGLVPVGGAGAAPTVTPVVLITRPLPSISLPGTGERPVAPVYIDGEKGPTLKGERIAEEFQELVERYVARHFPRREA